MENFCGHNVKLLAKNRAWLLEQTPSPASGFNILLTPAKILNGFPLSKIQSFVRIISRTTSFFIFDLFCLCTCNLLNGRHNHRITYSYFVHVFYMPLSPPFSTLRHDTWMNFEGQILRLIRLFYLPRFFFSGEGKVRGSWPTELSWTTCRPEYNLSGDILGVRFSLVWFPWRSLWPSHTLGLCRCGRPPPSEAFPTHPQPSGMSMVTFCARLMHCQDCTQYFELSILFEIQIIVADYLWPSGLGTPMVTFCGPPVQCIFKTTQYFLNDSILFGVFWRSDHRSILE